jgi:hypothetical protein
MPQTYAAQRQAHLELMGADNLAKRESAMAELGDRYLCHPARTIRREAPAPAHIPASLRAPRGDQQPSRKLAK